MPRRLSAVLAKSLRAWCLRRPRQQPCRQRHHHYSSVSCTGGFARYVEPHGLSDFAAGQRRSDMRSWHFAETGQPHMVRHSHTSLWRVSQHAVFRRPGPTPGPSLRLVVAFGSTIARSVADPHRLRHLPGRLGKGAAPRSCGDHCWRPLCVVWAVQNLGSAPPSPSGDR